MTVTDLIPVPLDPAYLGIRTRSRTVWDMPGGWSVVVTLDCGTWRWSLRDADEKHVDCGVGCATDVHARIAGGMRCAALQASP